MSAASRIGLAVYLAGFILFAGLIILIVVNALEVTTIELSASPFVLAAILVLSGKFMMAQATKNLGKESNG